MADFKSSNKETWNACVLYAFRIVLGFSVIFTRNMNDSAGEPSKRIEALSSAHNMPFTIFNSAPRRRSNSAAIDGSQKYGHFPCAPRGKHVQSESKFRHNLHTGQGFTSWWRFFTRPFHLSDEGCRKPTQSWKTSLEMDSNRYTKCPFCCLLDAHPRNTDFGFAFKHTTWTECKEDWSKKRELHHVISLWNRTAEIRRFPCTKSPGIPVFVHTGWALPVWDRPRTCF